MLKEIGGGIGDVFSGGVLGVRGMHSLLDRVGSVGLLLQVGAEVFLFVAGRAKLWLSFSKSRSTLVS